MDPLLLCATGVFSWGRHDLENIYALLALCEGNPQVTGGILSQRASNAELWYFRWTHSQVASILVTN